MFENEFQAKHRVLASAFADLDMAADIAVWRSKELAGLAARDVDQTRAAEYRGLADEWRAKADKLKAEAHEANRAIDEHVSNG